MKCTRKNIQYLPEDKSRRFNQGNEIENYSLSYTNVVSNAVKSLKDSIYSYKVRIEPVELKKEEAKKKLLKDKLQKLKATREKEKKDRLNKLTFLRKNYSNLMILQEMTKQNRINNSLPLNRIQIEENEKDVDKHNPDVNLKKRNNSSMFLTTYKQEASTEGGGTSSVMKQLNKCFLSGKVFNRSQSLCQSQSKTLSRTKSMQERSSSPIQRKNKYHSIIQLKLNKSSRNFNKRRNSLFNQGLINSTHNLSIALEKYKSSIENIFKRANSYRSKYSNIKSRLEINRTNKFSKKTKESNQPISFLHNHNLVNAIKSTKQIENNTQRLSFAINFEKERLMKIKRSIKEKIDKGISLQENPEKQEYEKMKFSIQVVKEERKVRMNEFEYAVQMKIVNQDYNGLSHLNNDVAYSNRRYIKERLGMSKKKSDGSRSCKDKEGRANKMKSKRMMEQCQINNKQCK